MMTTTSDTEITLTCTDCGRKESVPMTAYENDDLVDRGWISAELCADNHTGSVVHTAIPWKVGTDHVDYVEIQPEANSLFTVAKVTGFDKAEARDNARFIVTAVNHHAALVEALQAAISFLEDDSRSERRRQACLSDFRAALATVGEGEGR